MAVDGAGPTPQGDCSLETGELVYGLGYTNLSGFESIFRDTLQDAGIDCPMPPELCIDACWYRFPSDDASYQTLVDTSAAQNLQLSRIRVGLTPQASSPFIRVDVTAFDLCEGPI